MNKKVLKIICIISGIVFVTLVVLLIISAVQFSKTVPAASVGIIGGADGPTAIFLTQRIMFSPIFMTMGTAFLVFVGTGIAWLVGRRKNGNGGGR